MNIDKIFTLRLKSYNLIEFDYNNFLNCNKYNNTAPFTM